MTRWSARMSGRGSVMVVRALADDDWQPLVEGLPGKTGVGQAVYRPLSSLRNAWV